MRFPSRLRSSIIGNGVVPGTGGGNGGGRQLLAALLRIALIPLVGYAVVRLARRWRGDVDPAPGPNRRRGWAVCPMPRMTGSVSVWIPGRWSSRSEIGRWCFAVGGVLMILAFLHCRWLPSPRAERSDIGPVGAMGGSPVRLLHGLYNLRHGPVLVAHRYCQVGCLAGPPSEGLSQHNAVRNRSQGATTMMRLLTLAVVLGLTLTGFCPGAGQGTRPDS